MEHWSLGQEYTLSTQHHDCRPIRLPGPILSDEEEEMGLIRGSNSNFHLSLRLRFTYLSAKLVANEEAIFDFNDADKTIRV